MKRSSLIFFIAAGVVFLLAAISAIVYISNGSYRKQLPEYPDMTSVSVYLKNQILTAGKKAILNPSANNLGQLGMVYNSSSYYDKAAQCYKLALRKDSDEWIWSYYLGYLNLEQGESEASVENFKSVIAKDPQNYLALFYSADAFQNMGLNIEAEKIFKKIGELDENNLTRNDTIRDTYFPLSTYAMFRLARIYINSDRLDSAEIVLRNIIEKQVKFGPAYRLLGNVYNLQGNVSLADKYTIRANDLAEYTPPADNLIDKISILSRSDTYLLKQIDDAFRSYNFKWELLLCNQAMNYLADSKFLVSRSIYVYFDMGYEEKALSLLDRHLKFFSDDFSELINMAQFLFSKGYASQAMNYFDQAKKINHSNSKLALLLSDWGMKNDAILMLDEQLKKDPENIIILTDAVKLTLRLSNIELAKSYLNRIKNLNPSDPEVLKLSGVIAENEKRTKDAIVFYEQAFLKDPKDIYIIRYLSETYIREKMWNKAINHYKLSLVSYPNNPILQEGLGNLLITCPDPKYINIKEGLEYSERAFINVQSTLMTVMSAGKNIAVANAISGDKQKASEYISITTEIARKGDVPMEYCEKYFESVRKQYNL